MYNIKTDRIMRKLASLFMRVFPLATLVVMAGCQIQDIDVQEPDGLGKDLREVIITASISDASDQTRTTYNETESKNYWTPGDKIKVFSAGEAAEFTSMNTTLEPIVKFKGYIASITGSSNDDDDSKDYVWGFYPYSEGATYEEPDGISRTARITTTYTDVQPGVAGTFGDNLAVMIGRSESLSIPFRGAYSGAFFQVSRNDIVSMTLRGLNDEVLAGTATIGLNNSLLPVVYDVTDGKTAVTVTAPNGTFETGKNYYIITLPDVALPDGYSVTLRRSDGYEGTYELRANRPLNRIKFRNLSEPVDVRIENAQNISSGVSTGWVQSTTQGLNEILYLTSSGAATFNTDGETGNQVTGYGLKRVGTKAYRYIRFAGPVTEIDASAFEGQSNITTVILPSSVTTIKENAFKDCSGLTDIDLGGNVKTIKEKAFFDCNALPYIDLPEGLESIGDQAFAVCGSFSYVYLPSSLSEIGSGVFESSSYIEEFAGAYAYDDRHLIKDGRLIAFAAGEIGDNYTEVVPEGVTVIDRGAYAGSTMAGIVLPETLVEIGPSALAQCFYLKNLTIPASVTKIHDFAFEECEGLEWVKIKKSDSMIEAVPNASGEWYAFDCTEDCPIYVPSNALFWYTYGQHWDEYGYKLGEYNRYKISPADNEIMYTTTDGHAVVLPDEYSSSVTVIAPEDNGGIGIIRAESDWTTIPTSMFDSYENPGTANLKSVTIPDKVTSIQAFAFFYCESLESVTFGSSVTTIADNAFFNCGLTTVRLPDSVTYVANGAFGSSDFLSTVYLPAGLTTIVGNPFMNCKNLAIFAGDNSYISSEGNYLVRPTGQLFSYAAASTAGEFVIPESITSIGDYAFAFASFSSVKLMSFTPPTLGRYVFNGLDEYDIMVPDVAFSDYQVASGWSDTDVKSHLKYYQSTWSIWYTTTDGEALPDPTALPSACTLTRNIYLGGQGMMWFSNKVNDIPENMFKNTNNINDRLKTVSLPDDLRTIGASAFNGCVNLESVHLGANLETIGALAFSSCNLSSIEFPDHLTTLGNQAFKGTRFETISIPRSVTTIGSNPFAECYSLQSFTGDSPLISPDGHCLIYDGVLESFTTVGVTGNYRVPSGVVSISPEAMRRAIFTTVSFPSTLQTIGVQAVRQCENLSTVVIPASVTVIGAYAFDSCPALESITMESVTPPSIHSTSFRNLPSDCVIWIPNAGASAYEAATGWSDLTSYFQVY